MKTLGMRHVALNVRDPQISKQFYIHVLKMSLEWEPDAENVYLTSDTQDNLALHQAPAQSLNQPGHLDHIGFMLESAESVEEWYQWVCSQGVTILKEVKTHRDGSKSFYMADPDGVTIQMIYHPTIAQSKMLKS